MSSSKLSSDKWAHGGLTSNQNRLNKRNRKHRTLFSTGSPIKHHRILITKFFVGILEIILSTESSTECFDFVNILTISIIFNQFLNSYSVQSNTIMKRIKPSQSTILIKKISFAIEVWLRAKNRLNFFSEMLVKLFKICHLCPRPNKS